MKIDTGKLKNKYVYLPINGGKLTVQVKVDIEGVVVDVFNEDDEVVETTWKMYQEMIDGDTDEITIHEIDGRWTCISCGQTWSATLGDDEIPTICSCQMGVK